MHSHSPLVITFIYESYKAHFKNIYILFTKCQNSNLCSVIPVNFDVAVRNWYGKYVERNNNGMKSTVFISDNCAGKLPFYISISLKAE